MAEAATVCHGGSNRRWLRLQSYVVKAAAVGGCSVAGVLALLSEPDGVEIRVELDVG